MAGWYLSEQARHALRIALTLARERQHTAATATASTVVRACRRPRRWRGSAIWAR
jgi:hypothetical protein